MPRQPDPDLEERILKAAQALWKRGGDKALTLRAVARAAGTNTPAVYRRFKDRRDLVRGLLLRIVSRMRRTLRGRRHGRRDGRDATSTWALRDPHEYELFYTYGHELSPRQRTRARRPDPGVETQLRIRGSATGEAAGRFPGGSHAAGAGALGTAARDDDAAAVEIDSRRA